MGEVVVRWYNPEAPSYWELAREYCVKSTHSCSLLQFQGPWKERGAHSISPSKPRRTMPEPKTEEGTASKDTTSSSTSKEEPMQTGVEKEQETLAIPAGTEQKVEAAIEGGKLKGHEAGSEMQ